MESGRRDRLAVQLAARDIDAALVTDLVNVRYLTGFTGSNGALLVHASGAAAFATDGRYTAQASLQCPDLETTTTRRLFADLLRAAGRIGRLAVETHALTVDAHAALSASADPDSTLVSLDRAVETLRVVKDDGEIAALQRACAVIASSAGARQCSPVRRAAQVRVPTILVEGSPTLAW